MAYQVCPLCKGGGKIDSKVCSLHKEICPVCKGYRVINENTGKPPSEDIIKKYEDVPYLQPHYIVTCYTDAYKQPLKLD